jgi:hypothetical protein
MKGAWQVLSGDEINWAADLLRRYPLALLSEWEKEVEGCNDRTLPRGGGVENGRMAVKVLHYTLRGVVRLLF